MVLRAEGISRQFLRAAKGKNIFWALDRTDFVLEEGKLTVLGGRSGSGKSTLMNVLSGILTPTTGTVWLDNQNLYQLEDEDLSRLRNRSFGYVPQGMSAIRSLTVMENVLLPFSLYGESEDEDALSYAKELLCQMGIWELRDVMPGELSGGEMRRMAIARALVRRPAVVFADEPTGDLDDENTKVVLALLKELAAGGMSVLLVTHENEARNYADIRYHMNSGKLSREI